MALLTFFNNIWKIICVFFHKVPFFVVCSSTCSGYTEEDNHKSKLLTSCFRPISWHILLYKIHTIFFYCTHTFHPNTKVHIWILYLCFSHSFSSLSCHFLWMSPYVNFIFLPFWVFMHPSVSCPFERSISNIYESGSCLIFVKADVRNTSY